MRAARISILTFTAALAAACGGSDDGDGPAACLGTHFAAAPTDWLLPDFGPAWAHETTDQFSDDVNWALLDLDGDRRLDLVVTQQPGVVDVGQLRWVVYPNTGSGFGDPTDWLLPDFGPAWAHEPFDRFSDDVNWALLDLDGDHRLDLVVTQQPGVVDVGQLRWVVYPNTGSGFGDATDWLLPDLGPAWAHEPTDRFSDDVNWALLDLDGAGGVELVVTQQPGVVDVGQLRWLRYPNTGHGFGDPTDWLLPDFGPAWAHEPFDRFSDDVNWALLDLDGAGGVELVVTQQPGVVDVGQLRWVRYPNTGGGFGDPVDWPLPDFGPAWAHEPFDRFSDGVNWALLDRSELVIAQQPGAVDVGQLRWVRYPNTGSSFGDPVDWPLPDYGPAWAHEPFDRFSDDVNWALLDLDGDRRSELVIAQDPAAVDVGRFRWQLYANQCD